MAKRRRLSPAPTSIEPGADAPEAKALYPVGSIRTARPPVAHVAGAAAELGALEELSRGIAQARDEGRLATHLPLSSIVEDHLVRDRVALDESDMAALESSLRVRGQQTPIEVVSLGGDRYGLVSGWRRVTALRRLGAENVLAVIRRPDTAAEAYQAMVEENEIRAPLTYWERAHVSVRAAALGVYPDTATAIAELFRSASRAKRSKIGSFAALVGELGSALRFPTALSERTGLALAQALDREGSAARLREALRKAAPETAEAERRVLERALRKAGKAPRGPGREVAPGIVLRISQGRAVLSGPAVDARLAADLEAWLAARS